MRNCFYHNVSEAIKYTADILKKFGTFTEQSRWQGTSVTEPMWEYLMHRIICPIPNTATLLEDLVMPDRPWAENHFKERVSGKPLNPGEEYKNWPYYKHDEKWRSEGKFTHTYMERYWPKHAGTSQPEVSNQEGTVNEGIRYTYGDLRDVINLLRKDPHTRQAYLPVWFPEDTGVNHGGRVPCSIGYLFIMRENKLHIHYTIRACDYIRHFKNDIYLTMRLAQWVLNELKKLDTGWYHVEMGNMVMDIDSLHVFFKERNLI